MSRFIDFDPAQPFLVSYEIWKNKDGDAEPTGMFEEEWFSSKRKAEARARYISRRYDECNPSYVTCHDDDGEATEETTFFEGRIDCREMA